jgi:hypothetical protein
VSRRRKTIPGDMLWRLFPLRNELNEGADRFVNQGPDGFPGAEWALFGSLVLVLHGLRESISDVDVFVEPELWLGLSGSLNWRVRLPHIADPPFLERNVGGFRAHAFYQWTPRDPWVDADKARGHAETIDGWKCTPLELIREHKTGAWDNNPGSGAHEKHARDVRAIDEYLGRAA